MVDILVANKAYKYPSGRRSQVIYIGTTGKGAERPAVSAVNKASEAFELRGVKTIEVYIVTSGARKAVKTWLHLEALLPSQSFEVAATLARDNVNAIPCIEHR
jgi:hypothetical protein